MGLEARQRRPRSVKMSALGLTQALRLPSASAEGEPATAELEASQRSERRLPGLKAHRQALPHAQQLSCCSTSWRH